MLAGCVPVGIYLLQVFVVICAHLYFCCISCDVSLSILDFMKMKTFHETFLSLAKDG